MAQNEIMSAIKLVAQEKGLSYEAVLETLEIALAAAFRKDFGNKQQNIVVQFDPETGAMRVFDVKLVTPDFDLEVLARIAAEEAEAREAAYERGEMPPEPDPNRPRYNPKTDLMFTEAQAVKPGAQIGEEIRTELEVPAAFGRMAAQTAKQVIMQKLREAERSMILSEFAEHQGTVIIGTVQRREGRNVLVDLGRGTGIMFPTGQIYGERYETGARYKFFVESVGMGPKGPEIVVSRTHEALVTTIFGLEIPEIAAGSVVIKGVAREAGARSKVAVMSTEDGVDPVGACIGQRGTRIQTIIHELGGEKIDIIQWSEDTEGYIRNALSPAKVHGVQMEETVEGKIATVTVAEDQFSLAIGKGGQNVRLAARLTGWKININQEGGTPAAAEADAESEAEESESATTEEAAPVDEAPVSEEASAEAAA